MKKIKIMISIIVMIFAIMGTAFAVEKWDYNIYDIQNNLNPSENIMAITSSSDSVTAYMIVLDVMEFHYRLLEYDYMTGVIINDYTTEIHVENGTVIDMAYNFNNLQIGVLLKNIINETQVLEINLMGELTGYSIPISEPMYERVSLSYTWDSNSIMYAYVLNQQNHIWEFYEMGMSMPYRTESYPYPNYLIGYLYNDVTGFNYYIDLDAMEIVETDLIQISDTYFYGNEIGFESFKSTFLGSNNQDIFALTNFGKLYQYSLITEEPPEEPPQSSGGGGGGSSRYNYNNQDEVTTTTTKTTTTTQSFSLFGGSIVPDNETNIQGLDLWVFVAGIIISLLITKKIKVKKSTKKRKRLMRFWKIVFVIIMTWIIYTVIMNILNFVFG